MDDFDKSNNTLAFPCVRIKDYYYYQYGDPITHEDRKNKRGQTII